MGAVLERIGFIYSAAAAGSSHQGLGQIEFRGYVASVLTQILRELEARQNQDGGERSEHSSPARAAGDAAQSVDEEGADTSTYLIETLRGLFANVAWPFPAWDSNNVTN